MPKILSSKELQEQIFKKLYAISGPHMAPSSMDQLSYEEGRQNVINEIGNYVNTLEVAENDKS